MGNKKDKTDKKTNTYHIDTLRKKYEILLLEDRKRKERNEYILNQLDKMRTCTVLAHPHNKSNIQYEVSFMRPSSNNTPVQVQPRVSKVDAQFCHTLHPRAPDIFAQTNAALVLKDIYKHYILIPKQWPSQRENSVQVDTLNFTNATDANLDWKSKYDILNKLKQEEKEELQNDKPELAQSEYQNYCSNYPNLTWQQYDANIPEKNTITLEDKNNDKDIFSEIKSIESIVKPTINPVNDQEKQSSFDNIRAADKVSTSEENIENKVNKAPSEPAELNPKSAEISHEPVKINPDPFSKIEGSEKIEHLDDDGINPAHISYPSDTLGKPFGEVPDNIEDGQYPIDVINYEDFTPRDDVAVHDGVNVNPKEYDLNKSHFESFPPHEEFTSPEDVIVKDGVKVSTEEFNMNESNLKPTLHRESEPDAPAQHPKIEKGELNKEADSNPEMILTSRGFNSEPVNEPSIQLYANTLQTVPVPDYAEDLGNPIDTAFVTEQEESIYEGPISDIAYNQNVEGETWDPTTSENYVQNEPYYYEGPHEQESVQINEHEETSTLYDQNYEQQYMTNYEQQFDPPQEGYDQPQYGIQQYEQQGYDQTEPTIYNEEAPIEQFNPEYNQQLYKHEEYEAVQQVEETLNQEEGYVAIQEERNQEPNVANQQ